MELLQNFFQPEKQRKLRMILIGLIPAYIFYILYLVAPVPLSAYYSLFDWPGYGEMTFVGLENWLLVLKDTIFWRAIGNNLIIVVLSIICQLPIGLFLGILITKGFKGKKAFRAIYFAPYLMSEVAVGILWGYIYDPTFGLLNNVLQAIGLGSLQQAWLGNPNIAIYAVIAAMAWRYIPFYMILFSAALVGIPDEYYEAASIDGASGFKAFRHITFPLLIPTITNACILSLTGSLKYFGLIYTLTGGGPNHATELMATYMFKKAFEELKMGYGSTIGVYLFLIAFGISVTVLLISKRKTKDSI